MGGQIAQAGMVLRISVGMPQVLTPLPSHIWCDSFYCIVYFTLGLVLYVPNSFFYLAHF